MATKLYCTVTTTHLDEMCTTCWRCAIVRVTIHILRSTGVSERISEYCAGCQADMKRGY